MDEAASCLTGNVNINCGYKAAAFLETITLGIRPPACGTKMPLYSAGPASGTGDANVLSVKIDILLFSIILSVVLHRFLLLL